jgi:hypothetical protein
MQVWVGDAGLQALWEAGSYVPLQRATYERERERERGKKKKLMKEEEDTEGRRGERVRERRTRTRRKNKQRRREVKNMNGLLWVLNNNNIRL